jgi:hypothetical protein
MTQFDSDTSLLAGLDKAHMDILLESIHPIVDGNPDILQDHYIIKQDEQMTLSRRPSYVTNRYTDHRFR